MVRGRFDDADIQAPELIDQLQGLQQAIRLHTQGRLDQAAIYYLGVLNNQPDEFDAMHLLGVLRHQQGHHTEALDRIQTALKWRPTNALALSNLGQVFETLGRPEDALASYEKALAIRPDFAVALNNRGIALHALGRYGEALASYELALGIRPDCASTIFNRALTVLLMGEFSAGWIDYEYRWDRPNAVARRLIAPWPNWKGESVYGKRIIVYDEQGLGDLINVWRFVPRLVERGAEVTFFVRSSMHRTLGDVARAVRLVTAAPEGEAFDYQCALMSLPGSFGTSLENIPSNVPYLYAEKALIARWQERLGKRGLKIGICWQTNPDATGDIGRSIPLSCFQRLARISGVRLISLQKAHGLEQLEDLPAGMEVETLGDEFDSGPDAFIDTAAVMCCLDLIVTCDTSVAHLAGALGRPVWLALKHVPDWRWMLQRPDSPWYPSMRLYRQTIRNDWNAPFAQIADDVAKLMSDMVSGA